MSLIRTVRAYFKQPTADKSRFRTNDKPTQANYDKLFDAVAFIKEASDTASTSEQGLVKRPTDQQAIDKAIPSAYTDSMSRSVFTHQIPDVTAHDTTVVITPVIWDVTLGAEAADTTTNPTHDFRRRYKIKAAPNAQDGVWKTIGGGGSFDADPDGTAGPAVPAYALAMTGGANSFQVRKTANNRIAIRGFMEADAAMGALELMFTLPVGYIPAKVVFIWDGGEGLNISVNTSGEVVAAGFTGTTKVVIPEVEFSLD